MEDCKKSSIKRWIGKDLFSLNSVEIKKPLNLEGIVASIIKAKFVNKKFLSEKDLTNRLLHIFSNDLWLKVGTKPKDDSLRRWVNW